MIVDSKWIIDMFEISQAGALSSFWPH